MTIVALDPSFTSTGCVACTEEGEYLDSLAIHEGGSVYSSNEDLHKSCKKIIEKIRRFIEDYILNDEVTLVVEIPAPNTSGWYLAILHGWIISTFSEYLDIVRIVTIPPGAVNSYTKNKSKTKSHIVDYAKFNGFIPNKRLNNDIATAAILVHVYLDWKQGKYKNTVNTWLTEN